MDDRRKSKEGERILKGNFGILVRKEGFQEN